MFLHRHQAVPRPDATLLPLFVSGLTAAIALQHAGGLDILSLSGSSESASSAAPSSFAVAAAGGKPSRPKTVLVTAAAGATGMFAVQLAKLGGAHVIGTCSSSDKVDVLKRLGCDRVVNYKKESLNSVLHKEYKGGIDVVYESVGGEFLDICIRHLAVKGRLIVIGFISGYSDGSGWKDGASPAPAASKVLPVPWYAELLRKSATVSGFFLNDYARDIPAHMKNLTALVMSGRLQSVVDDGSTTRTGSSASDQGKHTAFTGLADIANAIDHMYRGANIGKVVVRIGKSTHVRPSKL